jgi:hypothetical protein
MDEVDFTILAATSVFTDLIEKCPPAEACRDAFDRTAKATLKMANSTGGFGQVLPPAQPTHSQKRRNSRGNGTYPDDRHNWSSAASSSNRGADPRQHRINRHQQRASIDYTSSVSASTQRQQYDMTSADYAASAASSAQFGALPPPPHQNPAKRFRLSTATSDPSDSNFSLNHQAAPHSTTSSTGAVSPDTSNLMPSPSQQTPPIIPLNSPASSLQTSNPVGPTNFYDPLQSQNPLFSDSGLQAMDFLQATNNGLNAGGGDFVGGSGGGQDTQMDLNFGLGWEGIGHDFSDGQQLDLFDGFFFGDQRGGAGGGNGMGLGMVLDQAASSQGMKETDGQGQER